MNSPRTTLYRDKQNGKIMGVCAGIADYTGVNALWVRLGAIILLFAGMGMIVPLYLLAGLLLNRKPAHLYTEDLDEKQYWQRVRQNPKRTVREVRGKFRDIDRRLAEVETFYVSSNPRLTSEIERLR